MIAFRAETVKYFAESHLPISDLPVEDDFCIPDCGSWRIIRTRSYSFRSRHFGPQRFAPVARQVVLETHGGRRDRKSGKEMGTLVLDESRLKVDVTQPKKRLLTMPMSSIRDVEQDGNTCKVWVSSLHPFMWRTSAGLPRVGYLLFLTDALA